MTVARYSLPRTLAVPVLLLGLAPWSSLWAAEPAPDGVKTSPASSPMASGHADEARPTESPDAPRVEQPPRSPLEQRATLVQALTTGQLAPEHPAAPLFLVDLTSAELGPFASAALRRMSAALDSAALDSATPALEALPTDVMALADAWAAFFRLDDATRRRVLDEHAARHAEHQLQTGATARARAQALSELLVERDEPATDTVERGAALLTLDLLDPLTRASLRRVTRPEPAPEATGAGDEMTGDEPPAAAVQRDGEAELDAVHRRLLDMTVEERLALTRPVPVTEVAPEATDAAEVEPSAEQQEQRRREAARDAIRASATAERDAALAVAESAASESTRAQAAERARLLELRARYVDLETELERREHDAAQRLLAVDTTSERVHALAERPAEERAAEVMATFDDVYQQLVDARAELKQALRELRRGHTRVPGVLDGALPLRERDEALVSLRAALEAEERALRERERQVARGVVTTLHEQVTALNGLRLELLALAPARERARLTGFDRSGLQQAMDEAAQIRLELRYRALMLPKLMSDARASASASIVSVVWLLVQAVLLLVALVWALRRVGPLMSALHKNLGAAGGPIRHVLAVLAWYLLQLHTLLLLLASVYVALCVIVGVERFPPVELLWALTLWVLSGVLVIRLVHAMATRASRGARGDGETVALRLRSLRLVGLTVVSIGLLLSLTEETVGRGAIYRWVLSTCWLLAIPIAALLTTWWKRTIRARIAALDTDAKIAVWVLETERGLAGAFATAIGGLYLLGRGAMRLLIIKASAFEITRRVLAYMMRREVARQTESSVGDASLTPMNDELRAPFSAYREEHAQLEEDAWVMDSDADSLARLLELAAEERVTISVVAGERGIGKTTFLRRVQRGLGRDAVVLVRAAVDESDFATLLARVAEGVGAPTGCSEDELLAHLAEHPPRVICIDDVQNCVCPAIGGLETFRRLIDLARRSPRAISWVLAIASPGWHFVQRAYAELATFDEVVELSRWDERSIGALLDRRVRELGLDPSFDGVVIPRGATDDDTLSEEERVRRGFHRILWDYCDGNPAVALYWWRASLFRDRDDAVVVRLFDPPTSAQLESQPTSVYFVLRAILQLDHAATDDIVRTTNLSRAEVDNTIRFCLARGFIKHRHRRVYVTWYWFRAVSRVLWRRHLILH